MGPILQAFLGNQKSNACSRLSWGRAVQLFVVNFWDKCILDLPVFHRKFASSKC